MGKKGRNTSPRFGKLLQEARLASGIETQAEVAKKIKRSQSFVAQCESGLIVSPPPEMLKVLATAYKLRYEDLVAALVLERYGVDFTRVHAADLSLVILEKEFGRIKARLDEAKKNKRPPTS